MEMLVERLLNLGMFAGQTILVVVGLLVIVGFIFSLVQKNKQKSELEVEDLNQKYKDFQLTLQAQDMDKKQLKAKKKAEKKESKAKKKQKKPRRPKLFVLDFEGDIKAQAVDQLREEVSAVLSACQEGDQVLVCVESPGGVVHGYGLAAAQLQRIRQKKIPLTVCVDKVAASGGYMMACVADEIIAAPFAIIGSIGVLAQVPNFHRLLKKHDVDYREITSGEYKRTISLLGEITEKGEKKFTEQISNTHGLFKSFVGENRPKLDIEKVATGEYWFAREAEGLGLVDRQMTSDEFILSQLEAHDVQRIKFQSKPKLSDKLATAIGHVAAGVIDKVWYRYESSRFH